MARDERRGARAEPRRTPDERCAVTGAAAKGSAVVVAAALLAVLTHASTLRAQTHAAPTIPASTPRVCRASASDGALRLCLVGFAALAALESAVPFDLRVENIGRTPRRVIAGHGSIAVHVVDPAGQDFEVYYVDSDPRLCPVGASPAVLRAYSERMAHPVVLGHGASVHLGARGATSLSVRRPLTPGVWRVRFEFRGHRARGRGAPLAVEVPLEVTP